MGGMQQMGMGGYFMPTMPQPQRFFTPAQIRAQPRRYARHGHGRNGHGRWRWTSRTPRGRTQSWAAAAKAYEPARTAASGTIQREPPLHEDAREEESMVR